MSLRQWHLTEFVYRSYISAASPCVDILSYLPGGGCMKLVNTPGGWYDSCVGMGNATHADYSFLATIDSAEKSQAATCFVRNVPADKGISCHILLWMKESVN